MTRRNSQSGPLSFTSQYQDHHYTCVCDQSSDGPVYAGRTHSATTPPASPLVSRAGPGHSWCHLLFHFSLHHLHHHHCHYHRTTYINIHRDRQGYKPIRKPQSKSSFVLNISTSFLLYVVQTHVPPPLDINNT